MRRSTSAGQQRFGATHTQIKLGALANYLPKYTTVLKRAPFRLHYVDAFAGTGECTIDIDGVEKTIRGSASLALDCDPPFDCLLFIEKSRIKVQRLRTFVQPFSDREIYVCQNDANDVLPAYLSTLTRKDRAVVNLDPFGMDVTWETLEKIARSQLADVWYLLSLSGFYRQATLSSANIDADKDAALTRVCGPHDWRTALYEPSRQFGLFGKEPEKRTANARYIADWFKKCLQETVAGVAGPAILERATPVGTKVPIFALYFLVSNPSQKARDLALRIATAIIKKLPGRAEDAEAGPK